MCPDVLQFLTYMAGATVDPIGVNGVCTPWHDPLRAQNKYRCWTICQTDVSFLVWVEAPEELNLMDLELKWLLGMRFKESTELVLNALENGYAEYHGELIDQPRVDIRPRPIKSMRGIMRQQYHLTLLDHGRNGCAFDRATKAPKRFVKNCGLQRNLS